VATIGCGTAFGWRGLIWEVERGILPVHVCCGRKEPANLSQRVLLDAITPNGLANISRFVPVFKKVFFHKVEGLIEGVAFAGQVLADLAHSLA